MNQTADLADQINQVAAARLEGMLHSLPSLGRRIAAPARGVDSREAVTMRGLVLREVGLRHWRRVVGKEMIVGVVNGFAVAATTALGVCVRSRSLGLVLVCALAMVISMIAAGLAGALTPMLLRRFGQDPATSSSIILNTVTDVVGFFSFLGIATLLSPLLESSAAG